MFVVGEDLARGSLVEVLPGWQLPEQSIHALTTERDYLPRKIHAFIKFFRQRLGTPPYWEKGRTSLA